MKKALCTSCLVLFIALSLLVNSCFAIDKAEAESALAKAESDLSAGYAAVAEAERAGANVAELLARLRLGGKLLAEAMNAYKIGDYERAYSFAVNCSETVANIVYEAFDLKKLAEEDYSERLLFNAEISSVGLSILLVLSLFGWRFLKEKYFKLVLKMKPELERKPIEP